MTLRIEESEVKNVLPSLFALLGVDLMGWRFQICHFLILNNPGGDAQAKVYPAIIGKNQQTILTSDKSILEKAGMQLLPREFRLMSGAFITNEELEVAFSLPKVPNPDLLKEQKPRFLLTENGFERVASSRRASSPFMWTPGCFGRRMEYNDYFRALARSIKSI